MHASYHAGNLSAIAHSSGCGELPVCSPRQAGSTFRAEWCATATARLDVALPFHLLLLHLCSRTMSGHWHGIRYINQSDAPSGMVLHVWLRVYW